MNITERVERGAALLDERMPGWWQHIDLGVLDLGDGCGCVVGQIGDYPATLRSLGLYTSLDDYIHGFDGPDDHGDYAPLTEAWLALILVRQAAASVTA